MIQIQRPTHPAYITLLDSNGKVADRLDATQSQVAFSGQDITFSVSPGPVWGKQPYTLAIDGGVALDAEEAQCSTFSNPDKWDINVVGELINIRMLRGAHISYPLHKSKVKQ